MTLNNEQIAELIEEFDRESKAIKEEALRITWYMRGGISYNEAIGLSQSEREAVSKIIDSNIKTVEKTGLALL